MLTSYSIAPTLPRSLFAFLFLLLAFALSACGESAEVGADKKCMAEDNPLIDCRISRCEDGEVCALDEELCRPSSCFCDASTGSWICTADCGPAYSCQAPPSCEGPDPSVDCSTTGCTGDLECVVDPDACRSSSCVCEEETGTWGCTRDCGEAHVCVPPAGTCEGNDPSLDCRDTGCNDDEDCVIEDGACLPSSCSCDDEGWICTEDCGERHSCTPKSGEVCDTPDPSKDCRDTGCDGVQECLPTDGCRPSTCGCDSGDWFCTRDCRELYACQDPSGPVCEGTNPSIDCTSAVRCPAGSSCLLTDIDACRPSGCSCTDEGWTCTEDCNAYYECVVNQCEGPNPSIDCRDTGCSEARQTCQRDHGCRPSSCDCLGDTWLCTRDCQERYTCQDEAGPVCEGPDPSIDCTTTGCSDGLECVVSARPVCRPSSCACTSEGWICTSDCQPAHVCEPVLACDGPNPAGCTQEGCDQGFDCVVKAIDTECTPSRCECTNGQWLCTRDCAGGGVCIANI